MVCRAPQSVLGSKLQELASTSRGTSTRRRAAARGGNNTSQVRAACWALCVVCCGFSRHADLINMACVRVRAGTRAGTRAGSHDTRSQSEHPDEVRCMLRVAAVALPTLPLRPLHCCCCPLPPRAPSMWRAGIHDSWRVLPFMRNNQAGAAGWPPKAPTARPRRYQSPQRLAQSCAAGWGGTRRGASQQQ